MTPRHRILFRSLILLLFTQCQQLPETLQIVHKGQNLQAKLTGPNWKHIPGELIGSGIAHVAFINRYVQDAPFHMKVTLSLDTLNASTALVWIFGNHFGFDSNAQGEANKYRLFLYSPLLPEVRYLDHAVDYLRPGEPFDFELYRNTDSMFVEINQKPVTSFPLKELAGPLNGRIGLRPWRNVMRVYDWSFEGNTYAPPELDYIFESGKEGYEVYAIPALIKTEDHTLLAFCEGRKGAWYNDAGDIDLVMKRSEDGGNTWSPLEVVLDDGPHSCQNPVPIYDPIRKRVVLISTRKSAHDIYTKVLEGVGDEAIQIRVIYADPNGRGWTALKDITEQVKPDSMNWYATGPGSGLLMESSRFPGRMVIACNHTIQGDQQYRAHVMYSNDGGETWYIGGRIPGDGLNEGEVAEIEGGRLYINMRNYDITHHARRVSHSDDGGISWTHAEFDLELVEPRAQASVQTLEMKGKKILAFSNPDHPYFRQNMTLKISYDGGGSWQKETVIHPGPSANSDIVQLTDSTVGVLFQAGRFTYTDGVVFTDITKYP